MICWSRELSAGRPARTRQGEYSLDNLGAAVCGQQTPDKQKRQTSTPTQLLQLITEMKTENSAKVSPQNSRVSILEEHLPFLLEVFFNLASKKTLDQYGYQYPLPSFSVPPPSPASDLPQGYSEQPPLAPSTLDVSNLQNIFLLPPHPHLSNVTDFNWIPEFLPELLQITFFRISIHPAQYASPCRSVMA